MLLRALRDVNVPKFLVHDLPLFENIIKDLFPGVDKPVVDYKNLYSSVIKCIITASNKNNLNLSHKSY